MYIASAIPSMLAVRNEALINFFKNQQAFNKEHAINITQADLSKIGLPLTLKVSDLKQFPYIQVFREKYWLDQVKLREFYKQEGVAIRRVYKLFLYTSVVVLICIAIITLIKLQ